MTSRTPVAKRFGNGVMWNAVAMIALQGGTFATNLAVANLLGAEQYGHFGFLVGTAQTVASVVQLSTGLTASKYVAQHRVANPALALAILRMLNRISLAAGLLGAILLLLFASLAADLSSSFAGLGPLLALVAPIVACTVLNGFQTGALAGLDGYQSTARVMLPLALLQVASTSAAAALWGLPVALAAMTLNLAVRAAACMWLLSRKAAQLGVNAAPLDRETRRKVIVEFMVPSALSGITNLPCIWIATAALTHRPDGFVEIALLNAALGLRGVLMMVPWIVNTVGFSMLNAHLGRNHEGDYRRILTLSLLMCGGAAAVGAALVLAAPTLLLSAYGSDFTQAERVLRVLMLSLVAEALAWPLYHALVSRRRVWVVVLWTQLPRDVLIGALGVALATSYGALGVAWAHAGGWLLALLGCALLLVVTPRVPAAS